MTDAELVRVRKRGLAVETVYHEFGPVPERPVRLAAATAVLANPYAGRYVEDLTPFMTALRPLGSDLAAELADALGGNVLEIGVQDGPRPGEIVFGLVMADGGRVHARLGGLSADAVSVHDGQR